MSYIHNSKTNTSTLQSKHTITQTTLHGINKQKSGTNAVTPKKNNITQARKTVIDTNNQPNTLPENKLTNRSKASQTSTPSRKPKATQSAKTHDIDKAASITITNVKQEPDGSTTTTSSDEINTNTLTAKDSNNNNNEQLPTNHQSSNKDIPSEEHQTQTGEDTDIDQIATDTNTHDKETSEIKEHSQVASILSEKTQQTDINNETADSNTTTVQQSNRPYRIGHNIITTARRHPIATAAGICAFTVGIYAGIFGVEPAVAFASSQLQKILALFSV